MSSSADREFVQVREQHGLGPRPLDAVRPQGPERLSAAGVLRSLSDALLGEEHGAQAWWEVLAAVVADLGLVTVADFDSSMRWVVVEGSGRGRCGACDPPLVPNAVVVDQLLRLGLGPDYEEKAPHEGTES